jgi:hypothetical protein
LFAAPLAFPASDAPATLFRLTDVSATAAMRYLLNDRSYGASGDPSQRDRDAALQESLIMRTRGYVYLPEFLDITLAGGPLFLQQDFRATQGHSQDRRTLFDLFGGFEFLREKPYPVTLQFERGHPSVTTSLAGTFQTELNRYELLASLLQPHSPVSLSFDAFHVDTHGAGFGTTIDDRTEQASLRGIYAYRSGDRLSLAQTISHRDSASGTSTLEIQRTALRLNATDIDATNYFGARGQVHLNQTASYYDEDLDQQRRVNLRDARYNATADWQHTTRTRSYLHANHRQLRYDGADSQLQSVQVGAVHRRSDDLALDFSLRGSQERATGAHRDVTGASGTATYAIPWRVARLRAGVALSMDSTNQVASVNQLPVVQELLTLSGSASVELRQSFVVSGSVVVRNDPRTQTFVENIDYRLVVVGATTSVQRLIGGAISDGDTVRVDYEYRVGGTVSYRAFGQSYTLGAALWQRLDVYARFGDTRFTVTGGQPTIPLNWARTIEFGLRADYPIGSAWVVGGQLRRTEQRELTSPYIGRSVDAYVQLGLPRATSLNFTVLREQVDNLSSHEDVDLTQYVLHLRSAAVGRLTLSLDADMLRDTGGSLVRRRRGQGLSLHWSYRAVRCDVRAEHAVESQGQTERHYTSATALLVREF